MPTHEDFVLPGLLSQPQLANGLIVSTLFAQSRVWNRCRLESHLYGFWNQVLSQLVFDCMPDILLVPQQVIYCAENPFPDPNCSGNTVAENVVAERIPDFVMFAISTRQRYGSKSGAQNTTFPAAYSSWRQMQIISAKPAAIIQIKRPPPRSIKKEDFIGALQTSLAHAADEAENSASLAFNDESYKLNKVVLIAAAGEWWRFKVVDRAGYAPVDFLSGVLDEGDEQEERKGKPPRRAQRKAKKGVSTR